MKRGLLSDTRCILYGRHWRGGVGIGGGGGGLGVERLAAGGIAQSQNCVYFSAPFPSPERCWDYWESNLRWPARKGGLQA